MNSEILKYVLLIAFSILGIFKNSISFNPIRFHCDNYILNNYLYIILSWGIILTTVATLYNNNVKLHELFSGPFTILLSLGSIFLLVGLLFIPPELFFTKHLLYIFQIVLMGIIIYPLYVNNIDLFNQVGITTLLLITFLSLVTYMYPDIIKDGIYTYLSIGLIGIIIARIVEMVIIYKNKKVYTGYHRLLSYISIALFSIFIMYDTKRLIRGAQTCVNPDYINKSLNLFLDSMNIFTNMYALNDN
tara:strand:+ start:629 stop:1366 length:738 start_codon:yes stop_codon:yes gene_type:complete